ncbi:MAG: hypothetical protein A2Z97_03865 [Bdellovibrionales bacterium GWB1_52_6]|nr:MAG: hypothetical protein A2Z97_03865 [Bdellovibrionales bacterium GWB1_52_6]OFZ04313.1 MAG: hypothetical protein A2X97_06610 [Bdellovibrionales bacterium GWA1_52_35]HCM40837.1 hypothetical protein [Bdellovibrionales bacterium]
MLKFALILFFATTSVLAQEADPLFGHMAGHWRGEGRRVFLISGREVLLQAEVFSSVEGSSLVSENLWTETTTGSKPFTYKRAYWIRATHQDGLYAMGYNNQTHNPAAYGHYSHDEGQFSVKQTVGDISVESTTLFSTGQSLYLETTWKGGIKISEASVQYTQIGHPAD